ncbi:MAG: hypothetical protein WCT35_07590 [Sideroxydans sp.]|jgi:uncharacterized protein HemX
MKTSSTWLVTLLTWVCLGGGAAWAEVVQHQSMTAQEYEAYRTQLQQQIEQANLPSQNKMTASNAEQSTTQAATEKPSGGYGQGYRARTERNDSSARMSARGSSMVHRGGGHGR